MTTQEVIGRYLAENGWRPKNGRLTIWVKDNTTINLFDNCLGKHTKLLITIKYRRFDDFETPEEITIQYADPNLFEFIQEIINKHILSEDT